jgi:hypothetical protein
MKRSLRAGVRFAALFTTFGSDAALCSLTLVCTPTVTRVHPTPATAPSPISSWTRRGPDIRPIRTPIRWPARASVAVIAALLCALAGPAHARAANVVPNPGFEQPGCGNTPVICGWQGGWMTATTINVHSGIASMALQTPTCHGACNPSDSWTSAWASTDPAFCAAIGPGTHPASF